MLIQNEGPSVLLCGIFPWPTENLKASLVQGPHLSLAGGQANLTSRGGPGQYLWGFIKILTSIQKTHLQLEKL